MMSPSNRQGNNQRAILLLDSKPSGAMVYLDGIRVGTTPYHNMQLRAGQQIKWRLSQASYHSQTQTLTLQAGVNEPELVSLIPAFGGLSIDSTPNGATVFLNGKSVGTTPYTNEALSSGRYVLGLQKEWYESPEEEVLNIQDDQHINKEYELVATFGELSVDVQPHGAEVRVIHQRKRVATFSSPGQQRLLIGEYVVQISHEDYARKSYRVAVSMNKTSRIRNKALKRLKGQVLVSSEPFDKGAKVLVNGEQRGTVPAMLTLTAKEHDIKVLGAKGEGEKAIRVRGGSDQVITVDLRVRKTFADIDFVWVPKGCFDREGQEVCLSQSYWLGKTEITQGQWQAVMGTKPSHFRYCGSICPVEQVSWNDAQAFIEKLNSKGEGKFALPTEAQWEYACRSGGKDQQYAGSNQIKHVAWYDENSSDAPHWVATKKANALGLYDMSGNVWEWTADRYGKYPPESQTDPLGVSRGNKRVLRGGSWFDDVWFLRCSNRGQYAPDHRHGDLGLRVLRMTE